MNSPRALVRTTSMSRRAPILALPWPTRVSSLVPKDACSLRDRCTFWPISTPRRRPRTMVRLVETLSVVAFALVVVLAIVGLAFAAGYLVGQLLL
jgi:hypothetical protein